MRTDAEMENEGPKKKKRRPGRDAAAESATDAATESDSVNASESGSDHTRLDNEPFERSDAEDNFELRFFGSDLIKARAPKTFDLVEKVAENWVYDKNFEGLPVGHPLAQIALAEGLKRAKKVEKKLEEKGVFMMARLGIQYAKSKLKI